MVSSRIRFMLFFLVISAIRIQMNTCMYVIYLMHGVYLVTAYVPTIIRLLHMLKCDR